MRWPWVSRALYIEVCEQRANLALRCAQIAHERDQWLDRYLDVTTPKAPQDTGSPPAVLPEPASPPRAKSLIAEAIKEESGGDPRLAAWYRKRVKEMRAEGKSDGDIVAAIRTWETTEDSRADRG